MENSHFNMSLFSLYLTSLMLEGQLFM